MPENIEAVGFFKRKDIEISFKRYVQDALSAMALGLFASLLIGLIFKTIGEQMINIPGFTDKTWIVAFLILVGTTAMIVWLAKTYAAGLATYWFISQFVQIFYNLRFNQLRKKAREESLNKRKKAVKTVGGN